MRSARSQPQEIAYWSTWIFKTSMETRLCTQVCWDDTGTALVLHRAEEREEMR